MEGFLEEEEELSEGSVSNVMFNGVKSLLVGETLILD